MVNEEANGNNNEKKRSEGVRNRKKKKKKSNKPTEAPIQEKVLKDTKERHPKKAKYTNKIGKSVFNQRNVAIAISVMVVIPVLYYQFGNLILEKYLGTGDMKSPEFEMEREKCAGNQTLENTFEFLSSFVCNDHDDDVYCHPRLVPSAMRRTHYAGSAPGENGSVKSLLSRAGGISQGETILMLPRKFLIWDLDAMRDDTFVQKKQLFSARHAKTGDPLDGGAFLAVYLAKRNKVRDDDDEMLPFFDMLPTYEQLAQYHPVLWSNDDLSKLLGKFTPSYILVKSYHAMIKSEHNALLAVDSSMDISFQEYAAMRINVISRSFGPGPPGIQEQLDTTTSLQQELQSYNDSAGVDFTKGCRAMSPILDMWDHHSRRCNAEWRYVGDAFKITASKYIPPGQDIIVSYGKYTDTHLFAKFGFVNGDGTEHTESSIAAFHRLLDVGMGQQFSHLNDKQEIPKQDNELLHYLLFDDGYKDCIDPDKHPDEYALKVLKWRRLKQIANQRDSWVFTIPPRTDADSLPENVIPQFDPKNVRFDASKLISTCRIISLTTRETEAVEALQRGDVFLEHSGHELEFRSLACLIRLTTINLSRYPNTIQQEMEYLLSSSHRDREWMAAHVRLGEMQTLNVLKNIAASGAKMLREEIIKNHDDDSIHIRSRLCSMDLSKNILNQ